MGFILRAAHGRSPRCETLAIVILWLKIRPRSNCRISMCDATNGLEVHHDSHIPNIDGTRKLPARDPGAWDRICRKTHEASEGSSIGPSGSLIVHQSLTYFNQSRAGLILDREHLIDKICQIPLWNWGVFPFANLRILCTERRPCSCLYDTHLHRLRQAWSHSLQPVATFVPKPITLSASLQS